MPSRQFAYSVANHIRPQEFTKWVATGKEANKKRIHPTDETPIKILNVF
jgi:hypothetical protein